MDITYIIPDLGVSQILLNFNVEPVLPTFLIVLTDPSGVDSKNVLFTPTGCDGNWIIVVNSVNQAYEDLNDGIIYFDELGTWAVKIYVQDSNSNTDPASAYFITNALFQVVCDDEQFLLDNQLDLPL